jgi:hypothetical protein
MGGHPSTEIPCNICSKPVDLTLDVYADADGKAVHEECYVKHITSPHGHPPATVMMAD